MPACCAQLLWLWQAETVSGQHTDTKTHTRGGLADTPAPVVVDDPGITILDDHPVGADADAANPGLHNRSKGWLVGMAILLVGLLVFTYVLVAFVQVRQRSGVDQSRAVDAIVVLGAAQYDGRPSPVLEQRLDRALLARVQGHSSIIVTTGAAGPGDVFTEGFVSYQYLKDRGVPEEDLVVITDGTNTYESLSATANALDAAGLGNRVLLVSDPYHALRATEIAREVGLEAYFASTDATSTGAQLMRETAAVSIGRLIGYRRVSNLT